MEALGLDRQAEAVYRGMLAHPASGVVELAQILGIPETDLRSAMDRLSTLALIQRGRNGTLQPVRPEIGMELLLTRHQINLRSLQQQIDESRIAVAQFISEYGELTDDSETAEAERLTGIEAIRAKIAELTERTTGDIMTFAPGGAQRTADIDAAREVDLPMLQRGVRMRTIWLDSIRNDQPTSDYATWLHSLGGEVRTVPTLPVRLIILDRSSALLPVDTADASTGAVVLRGRGTVAALCALFERVWQEGTPLGEPRPLDEQGLTPQERQCLVLLGQGLTDQAVAGRLGVSHRTARRMAALLMEKLGARSRFEAGIKAVARGWITPAG
jgi:DNA-binding CsgD family transcriptional regulator